MRQFLLFIFCTANIYCSANTNILEKRLISYFPDGYVEKTFLISDTDKQYIESSAKAKIVSQIFTLYSGTNQNGTQSHAILANAIIRTHPIVFFGYVDNQGKIESVEIITFLEPDDYKPTESWLQLLIGINNSEDLFPGSTIANITGATLTARTITKELRILLEIINLKIQVKK